MTTSDSGLPEHENGLVMLDPTLQVAASASSLLAARVAELRGKKIGVVWNNKMPGDALFERMLTGLREQYGVVPGPILMKPYLGNVAPDDIFDELERTCDAVVTGIGD